MVGISRWTPNRAEFDSGSGAVNQFQSIDELMEKSTGAAIPIAALFSWLRGEPANVNGWSADLARHSEGRIAARRLEPPPQADLRVVLTP